MKPSASASAHSSKALHTYLAKIASGQLQTDTSQQSAYKLLCLLFAYKRSQYKLHLRWNKDASNHLALITLQELATKKRTDPVLNGIHDALMVIFGNEEAVKTLLETAEVRIDEISESQRAKATSPRELNAVLKRAEHHHTKNPNLMPEEIIEKLKNDVSQHGINGYDEGLEKFFYDENGKKNPREKHIALASVRNHISKIRKK
jgi:hypothetical protein